jgi:DNA-binding NtrC family response regulator
MEKARILAVDDDPLSLKLVERTLAPAGYEIVATTSPREALERARTVAFDVAVLDLRMPEMPGLEILRELKRRDPDIEVIVCTAYPDVDTAVAALREGAFEYLQKPVKTDVLAHRVARAVERRFLRAEVDSLRDRLGERLAERELLGDSPQMAAVRATIAKLAAVDSPVLIEGESGTGKELAAASLHRLSPRAGKPFIPVNCGAMPPELMESEFFGHQRGAFTGAVSDTLGLFRSAQGGTLFLDEVSEIPLTLQSKLLRVLQEKEVRPVGAARTQPIDVRILAATNRDLERMVKEGSFRQDLFYRLNVVRLRMPPLRERREEIPLLVAHALRRLNQKFGRDVKAVDAEALARLQSYDFPGNVRELENVLERAYALGASGEIGASDLPVLGPVSSTASAANGAPLPTLAQAELDLIRRALVVHRNDRQKTAEALGISARTLYRRLRELEGRPPGD